MSAAAVHASYLGGAYRAPASRRKTGARAPPTPARQHLVAGRFAKGSGSMRASPRVMAAHGEGYQDHGHRRRKSMDEETMEWNVAMQPALQSRMEELIRKEAQATVQELYESGAFTNAPPLPSPSRGATIFDIEEGYASIDEWHDMQWDLLRQEHGAPRPDVDG
mmetsp:Transcript_60441/g.191947  ORF Transcript_60441/g.191947 Transcript_60441/m.191947 type:complete len:164 (+) Transcript_60441:88-579(+)